MLVGYARVSTDEQNPQAQRDALLRAGVAEENLYVDHSCGAKSSRPQWDVVQRVLRDGDTLICTRLDRVGRSTAHLVATLDEFGRRGVAFRFLEQGIDTTTAEGRMLYRMLAAVAEFQRDLITANTREGLAAARARGRTGGRKPKLSPEQVRDAQAKYDSRAWTVQAIANLYGVPRSTLYNHLHTGSSPGPSATAVEPAQHTQAESTPPSEETLPAAGQERPARAPGPQRRSGSRRARRRYSTAELDAYQLEPVRTGGELTSYRVRVAGDVLGSIERAPAGHHGWIARDEHRSIQPHRGDTRRYARTRQHAVVDLLLGLGYSAEQ
ncbi:recombinase family protein [Bounagaea algeriensis]